MPGSTVTTSFVARTSSERSDRRGPSWMSRPTPWPRPWPKWSLWPASSITLRAAADVGVEGVGDRALGPADEAFFDRRLQRRVGELRRLGDGRQLLGVLDPPQCLDRTARGDRLDATRKFLLEFRQRADRHVVVL